MIYCLPREAMGRVTAPPCAQWYYFGTAVPRHPGIDFLPLPGLTEIACELRDEYLKFIDELCFRDGKLENVCSVLAEKIFTGDNLFLDLCYLRCAERLAATGADLVLVFQETTVFRTAYSRLAARHGAACRALTVPCAGALKLAADLACLLRSRAGMLKSALSQRWHARRYPCPAPTGPISLVRTWLDRRNFTAAGFREVYLDGLLARCRGMVVFDFMVVAGHRYREMLAQANRLDVHFVVRENFIGLADIFAAMLKAQRLPRRSDLTQCAGFDLSELLTLYRWRDWLENRIFWTHLDMRAVQRMASNGYEVTEVLYPFENQPWEKALNRAFAENYPDAERIGYQHTVLSELYLNMYDIVRPETRDCYPHRLYSSGEKSAEILRRFYGKRVRLARAYRFAGMAALPRTKHADYLSRAPFLLVLLPVDELLAREMVDKVRAAFAGGGMAVVFKEHPAAMLPGGAFAFISSGDKVFRRSARTVQLSDLLAQATVMLYSWSASCLEALQAGVPVVQLVPDTALNFAYLPEGINPAVRTVAELRAVTDGLGIRYQSRDRYDDFIVRGRAAVAELLQLAELEDAADGGKTGPDILPAANK